MSFTVHKQLISEICLCLDVSYTPTNSFGLCLCADQHWNGPVIVLRIGHLRKIFRQRPYLRSYLLRVNGPKEPCTTPRTLSDPLTPQIRLEDVLEPRASAFAESFSVDTDNILPPMLQRPGGLFTSLTLRIAWMQRSREALELPPGPLRWMPWHPRAM